MFVFAFPLALCLALASGRDYRLRAPPSVTHSIVNLGKMEFNFYLNSKPSASSNKEYEISHQSKPIHGLPSESGECPCKQNRPMNRNQNLFSPPDMLSKILMNDDLFKEPTSSSLCCSSHEQIQEELYLEFNPKIAPPMIPVPVRREFPVMPNINSILESLPPLQSRPMDTPLFKSMPYFPLSFDDHYKGHQKQKPKVMEIFLVPTRKPSTKTIPNKDTTITPDIQVVDDKKTAMVYNVLVGNSSVKKDLNQKVGEHLKDVDPMINKTTQTIQNNTV